MDALLPGDLADPDMFGHLWPGLVVLADGLAAGDVVADVVRDVRAAGVEEVEALAMVSPSASVAPSTAAPAAVPMRGLVILTRFSFR